MVLPLVIAHLCPCLAWSKAQKPFVDSALHGFCTTEKPDLNLSRRPLSPLGRLCHCLLLSWSLYIASMTQYLWEARSSRIRIWYSYSGSTLGLELISETKFTSVTLCQVPAALHPRATYCFWLICLTWTFQLNLSFWYLLDTKNSCHSTVCPRYMGPLTIGASLKQIWVYISLKSK